MENKIKPKTKELVVSKETLSEDPLLVSGLKFDKEKYENKVSALKKYLLENKLSITEEKSAKAAGIIYQAALSLEIPASGLTMLGGNPYINTAGLMYKLELKAKERNTYVKSIVATAVTLAKEAGDSAFFTGKVEFGDGSFFEDFGEASIKNVRMSTLHGFLNHMAARRATNRAIRLAVGFGLSSYDEMAEVEGKETETTEDKLLTEKEYKEIADVVAVIESCGSKEELEKVVFDKSKFNENQIRKINVLVENIKKKF